MQGSMNPSLRLLSLPVLLVLLFINDRSNAGLDAVQRSLMLPTGAGVVNGSSNPFIYTYLGNDQRRFYGRGVPPRKLRVLNRFYLGGGITYTSASGYYRWIGTGFTGQSVIYSDKDRRGRHRDYLIIGSYDHRLRKLDLNAMERGLSARRMLVWKYRFPDIVKGSPAIYYDDDTSRFVVLMGSRYGRQRANPVGWSSPYIWSYRAIDAGTGKEIWRMNSVRTHSYSRDNDGTGLYLPDRKMIFNASENSIGYFISSDTREKRRVPLRQIPYKHERRWKTPFYRPRILASRILYTRADPRKHGGELASEGSAARLGNMIYIAASSGHVWGIKIPERNDPSGTDYNDPNPKKLETPEWDYYIGSDLNGTIVISRENRLYVTVEKQFIKGRGGVLKLNPSKSPRDAVDWYMPVGASGHVKGKGHLHGGIIGSVAVNDEYLSPEKVPLVATNTYGGWFYVMSQNTVTGKKVWGPNRRRKHPTPRIVFKKFTGGTLSTPIFADGNRLLTSGGHSLYQFEIKYRRTNRSDPKAVYSLDGTPYRVIVKQIDRYVGRKAFEATPVVWKDKVIAACRDGYLYMFGKKRARGKRGR